MPAPINHHHSLLLAKRVELLQSRVKEDLKIEGRAPDPLDEALASSARMVAMDSVNRDYQTLKLVNKALRKLEEFGDDGYGVCEVCEEVISEARLDVLPWAERCINCQNEKDMKG